MDTDFYRSTQRERRGDENLGHKKAQEDTKLGRKPRMDTERKTATESWTGKKMEAKRWEQTTEYAEYTEKGKDWQSSQRD